MWLRKKQSPGSEPPEDWWRPEAPILPGVYAVLDAHVDEIVFVGHSTDVRRRANWLHAAGRKYADRQRYKIGLLRVIGDPQPRRVYEQGAMLHYGKEGRG